MLNKGSYIAPNVIHSIVLEATEFELTTSRAFNILGQYPIAPSTIGPVSIDESSSCIFAIASLTSLSVSCLSFDLHDFGEQILLMP